VIVGLLHPGAMGSAPGAVLREQGHDVVLAYRVEDALEQEWRESLPDLPGRLESVERTAAAKAWRWAGEMDEIAATFAAAGQPDGFHRAAAAVYRS
jgi:hypothetical protein